MAMSTPTYPTLPGGHALSPFRAQALLQKLQAIDDALAAGSPVGKRLDFLMQELNREANTIASKSIALSITDTALALKLLIEQLREQVQNLE